MIFKKILGYLNPMTMFQKKEENVNLRLMHGINRISIFMFLFCMIVMVLRYFTR